MRFRRRSSGAPDESVASFWHWWTAEGRALAQPGTERHADAVDLAGAMTDRVRALGDLSWELTAGETSEHVLVITAGGDPAHRALARRVVLAAPEADATWSYTDTRLPSPDIDAVVLQADGRAFDLVRVQVSARMNGGRFDVQLHHPEFAGLPTETRHEVTLLALEAALGEVDTELWLGEVTPAELPPLDGFGLNALSAVVRDLRDKQLDADGRPRWAMLRGETAGGPLVAMVRSPLHPLTAPHLDTYVQVVLPFTDRTDAGLPDGRSLQTLRDFEERLDQALGTSGQIVATLSTAGVRTLHAYVDSMADLLATVKELARSWPEGKAAVHDMHDPEWAAVSHLRT